MNCQACQYSDSTLSGGKNVKDCSLRLIESEFGTIMSRALGSYIMIS